MVIFSFPNPLPWVTPIKRFSALPRFNLFHSPIPIPNQKKIAFSHWGNHQLERLEQRIPWKLSSEVTSSGDAEQHNKTEVNTQNWAKCKVTIDHMPLILFKHLRIWTAALVKSMAYTCSPQEPWPVPSNFRHRSQIRVDTRGSLRHCI